MTEIVVKRVLFICTGNYYRSRFAEEWFNFLVRQERALHWVADSRGLALELRHLERRPHLPAHTSRRCWSVACN